MAKDEGATEAATPPKSKKMLIIIIVAVLVLAIGGGVAFMLLGGKGKKHGKDEATAAEDHSKPTPTVPFEEKFLVNLRSDDGSTHVLQITKIELEMADEESAKVVEAKKSKISDRINSTLRNKTLQEMQAPGSDLKLKEELRTVINQTIEAKSGKGVKEVLLPSSFLAQ